MWVKVAAEVASSSKGRKVIAGIVILVCLLVYAMISSPWTMLKGWMDKAFNRTSIEFFDDPTAYVRGDDNTFFAMQNPDAYKETYAQLGTKYVEAITEPYLKHWQSVKNQSLATARALGVAHATSSEHGAVCSESYCSGSHSEYSIVYSTFATGAAADRVTLSNDPTFPFFQSPVTVADCDKLNPLDVAVITSYFNGVGLEWDCFAGNHTPGECAVCDTVGQGALTYVLDAMTVPKDPVTGEYIGELASVDASKLIELIDKEKASFFVEHIPQADGSCSLGADCTLGHTGKLVSLSRSDLPTTYSDLLANPGLFAEPYFGIYYSHYCDPHTHYDDDDDPYYDHGWITDHTAVGFLEYVGFDYFRDYLHMSDFDAKFTEGNMHNGMPLVADNKMTPRVEEAYSNMRHILGIESSADYSLAMDETLRNFEPKRYRYMTFPGANGLNTTLPIHTPDGHLNISAGFKDSNYLAIIGQEHWGVDFPYPTGTPVYATGYGEVVKVQTTYQDGVGFGRYVVTYQGKNSQGDKYFFIYAHLNSVNVSEGMAVTPSVRIGSVGSTGNSTGPHLHYECRVVRADGTIESIDPFSAEGGLPSP